MLLGENRVALHCLLGKDERPGRGEESCVRMKLAEGMPPREGSGCCMNSKEHL